MDAQFSEPVGRVLTLRMTEVQGSALSRILNVARADSMVDAEVLRDLRALLASVGL